MRLMVFMLTIFTIIIGTYLLVNKDTEPEPWEWPQFIDWRWANEK